MNHQPVEITPDKLKSLDIRPGGELPLGGIWGTVESGQTWLATDGRRTVISAGFTVIYVLTGASNPAQNNKLFIQSGQGFRGEVTTYPLIEGARRAEPMARLAELQMQIMIGIFAASSGVGFAAVLATDVLDFTIKNGNNFGKWSRALGACVATRAVLKKHAPTLYDKLIDATLISVLAGVTDSLRNIPDAAVNDPKLLGRTIGAIIGKLGKKMATARLTALSAIWILLSTAAGKAVSALPGAVKLSLQDRAKLAESIISELRRAGVTITPAEAKKIVEELAAKPKELRKSLEQLRDAFQGIRAD